MEETGSTVRIFIGASASPNAASAAASMQEEWEHLPWLRWVPDENLHITVLFLGQVPKDLLENLIEMFRAGYAACHAIDPGLPTWAFGPHPQKARMLWLKYNRSREFTSLVRKSQDWFGQILPYPQQRLSPIPHITVARFQPKEADPTILLPKGRIVGSHVIHKLTLWKSDLYANGAEYTPLAEFQLGNN